MSQVLDDLRAVQVLLAEPDSWVQGTYEAKKWADPLGVGVRTCWCLAGAVWHVTEENMGGAAVRAGHCFFELNRTLMPGTHSVTERVTVGWNDMEGRTFDEVRMVLEVTIARLEVEESSAQDG